jgi:hypothetical protein
MLEIIFKFFYMLAFFMGLKPDTVTGIFPSIFVIGEIVHMFGEDHVSGLLQVFDHYLTSLTYNKILSVEIHGGIQ